MPHTDYLQEMYSFLILQGIYTFLYEIQEKDEKPQVILQNHK